MFTLFRVRRFDVSVVGAISLRFLADIPDVDREDSTWVRDFCVSRVLVRRLVEAWKKT